MVKNLSIIIPTLNEQDNIERCLSRLQLLRKQGVEIIIADGGSTDDTLKLVEGLADNVLTCARGRASQMNAGADKANGQHYLFLHADTLLPVDFQSDSLDEMHWGFFPVKLSGQFWPLRIIERTMNWRSRISGIGTGDQAIFVSAELFRQQGGYADIPLMEDVEFCRRLKSVYRPTKGRGYVTTSSRRWEQKGIVRTVLQMWYLRFAYFLGVSPHYLVRQYYS